MIDDPEVIELTVVFIYMMAVAQPLMACEFALAGSCGALATPVSPHRHLLRHHLGTPDSGLVFLWLELSVYWIFAVMLLDYSIKATMLMYRYRSGSG